MPSTSIGAATRNVANNIIAANTRSQQISSFANDTFVNIACHSIMSCTLCLLIYRVVCNVNLCGLSVSVAFIVRSAYRFNPRACRSPTPTTTTTTPTTMNMTKMAIFRRCGAQPESSVGVRQIYNLCLRCRRCLQCVRGHAKTQVLRRTYIQP